MRAGAFDSAQAVSYLDSTPWEIPLVMPFTTPGRVVTPVVMPEEMPELMVGEPLIPDDAGAPTAPLIAPERLPEMLPETLPLKAPETAPPIAPPLEAPEAPPLGAPPPLEPFEVPFEVPPPEEEVPLDPPPEEEFGTAWACATAAPTSRASANTAARRIMPKSLAESPSATKWIAVPRPPLFAGKAAGRVCGHRRAAWRLECERLECALR